MTTSTASRQAAATGLALALAATLLASCAAVEEENSCYNATGHPVRCMPPFGNAAYNLPVVEATNTCGGRGSRSRYCRQTGALGATKSCDECSPAKSHPPKFMVDLDGPENTTWWQSITLYEYQERNMNDMLKANITLRLGKSFEITYIRIKFYSPRPESFAIYKRTWDNDTEWIPYQYYSASCEETYGKPSNQIILASEQTKALCSDEYSDISPLTGGNVAFSTLEGRPGAYTFDNNPELQEFVTASEIRVELTRLNTFGDEVFGDTQVLQSYFFAISDISIGGRCKCNGHANKCVSSTGQGQEERLVCQCVHNTMGTDCDQCLPFYNDRPWAAANGTNANECLPCNCNSMTNRCFFDHDLYRKTGHGGHCVDCRDNTAGVSCERCKDLYYRRTSQDRCRQCSCNPMGSLDLQCDSEGRCRCKQGVTGDKCDQCQANYYDFSSFGCRECQCLEAGSLKNTPSCSSTTGVCSCKESVEGQNCDVCKPGFFNLQLDNQFGCTACFCNGHTARCTSALGYQKHSVVSYFDKGQEGWTAVDRDMRPVALRYNAATEDISVSARDSMAVYFLAPARFLGDQHNSYGQMLHFRLRLGRDEPALSRTDLVLEGNGRSIAVPMYAQGNPTPALKVQSFSFRLHEHPSYNWMPGLTSLEFQKLLANLTAIKIRATYASQGVGHLDDVRLETAQFRSGPVATGAPWVEQCSCPKGYVGQYCESCAPGYRRDPPNGGSFARCVPCDCNNHSDVCEQETGRCICKHNTVGYNCERCADGYYGYALGGTPDDCKACPCPGQGPCHEQLDMTVSCLNCPVGTAGDSCERCADGHYGDTVVHGDSTAALPVAAECVHCDCNANIDPNAVGNCNTTTGECLKCIYNTTGFFCEKCLPGFFGDALSLPKGDCEACQCYPVGSLPDDDICDRSTGQCNCQPHVTGRQCDQCEDGYFNITSGAGCTECACSAVGSIGPLCNIATGQCQCKPGVEGLRCDSCAANFFGFSESGCTECACSRLGSASQQCDDSGVCPCVDSERIGGAKCDVCRENKYNLTAGCLDCPACYNLVQDSVDAIRSDLTRLENILANLGQNIAINDNDFKKDLDGVVKLTKNLTDRARELQKGNSLVAGELSGIATKLEMYTAALAALEKKASDIQQRYEQMDVNRLAAQINSMEEVLTVADNRLQSEAREILTQIRNAIVAHGQKSENMSAMSDRANDIVRRQLGAADEVVSTAQAALATAREAQELARKIMTSPAELKKNLTELRQSFDAANKSLEAAKQQAANALGEAGKAYSDALNVYLEATMLTVSLPNISDYTRRIAEVSAEAKAVKDQAASMMKTHESLMENSQALLQDAEKLFNNTYSEQRVTDQHLAMADGALEIANKATLAAEETLRSAQNILKTLQGFDEIVRNSKEKAMVALKNITEIQNTLSDAESKTAAAAGDASEAVKDADDAYTKANDAESVAKMASQTAANIRTEAASTKKDALELQNAFSQLQEDAASTETEVAVASATADSNSKQIQTALTRADEAKNRAKSTIDTLTKSLEDVLVISDSLAKMPELNMAELERLEQLLNSTQRQLEAEDVDSKYKTLDEFRQQQSMLMNDYTSQLEQLRADVDNIELIISAIPTTCFRPPVLEKVEAAGLTRPDSTC